MSFIFAPALNKTAEYLETPQFKELRLGLRDGAEVVKILSIAALVASVAITIFALMFALLIGGNFGAFLFVVYLTLGTGISVLCFDAMTASKKFSELSSNASNFALVNVAMNMAAKKMFLDQSRKLIESSLNETLLLRHIYSCFVGDGTWKMIEERTC